MTTIALLIILLATMLVASDSSAESEQPYRLGELLHRDDFDAGMDQWAAELEAGGVVEARDGRLNVDVPAGCTVWFRPLLQGPVMIEYEATAFAANGPNDRVSDLNCFWMARDVRCYDDLFARPRSGKFADYNELKAYYVGLGGNGNTTTRFRRYIGDPELRPLLPEHDLQDPSVLLQPNVKQRIRLVAFNGLIQYFRDGVLLFTLHDPDPYRSGWFGFRTVTSHFQLEAFRVYRLEPAS